MKARGSAPAWRLSLASVLGAAAICVVPSSAGAAERVNDGGFEASTCDASDCTDSAWESSATSAFANGTGPICRSGIGSGNTACNGQGSVPFGGSTWARLGAGFKATAMFDGGIISALEQTVSIPTAPASLSFRLRIIDAAVATGELTVTAGETTVFHAADTTPGFASYAPVTIDVSAMAGTSPLFRFEGFSSRLSVGPLDSFDIDDISLTTVDPSTAVGPQRKKCKKRKKHRSAESAKKKKCGKKKKR